jgi:hypothetical protein
MGINTGSVVKGGLVAGLLINISETILDVPVNRHTDGSGNGGAKPAPSTVTSPDTPRGPIGQTTGIL